MEITDIKLREIFDSRGNPTVEADVFAGTSFARAAAPSGASTGAHEVVAFPEKDPTLGIKNFNSSFKNKFIGTEVDYHSIDALFDELDPERKNCGGNLSIAISLATAKLQAYSQEKKFYEIFGKSYALPYPLGNIIGGGAHSGKGSPEIQEFLCIPIGAETFKDAALANEITHKLAGAAIIRRYPNFTRGRNDEGAWAPEISTEEALNILKQVCSVASEEVNFEVVPALDVAASEFYDKATSSYAYKTGEKTRDEHIEYMAKIVEEFDIFFIEDPLHEDDFDGFAQLKKKVRKECLVCGDDLTVTNPERLTQAAAKYSINSIIVKPNQIGSLTKTEKVIKKAHTNAYTPVVSHRSGETSDTSIAHLAVGFSTPIIKCGITGGERLAKINELLRIEAEDNLKMSEKL